MIQRNCHKHGLYQGYRCPQCAKQRTRGSAWMATRKRILNQYGSQCAALTNGQRCMTHAPLEVHHINGDNSDNRIENLVPLCRPHHLQMPDTFAAPYQAWIA